MQFEEIQPHRHVAPWLHLLALERGDAKYDQRDSRGALPHYQKAIDICERTACTSTREYADALAGTDSMVCYAMKANDNQAVLSLLRKLGAGADTVSEGEIRRALAAGFDPKKIVYSGVGKSAEEMDYAMAQGVRIFNCESESELVLLDAEGPAGVVELAELVK